MASVGSGEAFQKVERLEEPSALWRSGGRGVRELRRLQQRVRATLEDWLAYYREAIGTLRTQTFLETFTALSQTQYQNLTVSPHLANSTLLNSSRWILFTVTRVACPASVRISE